MADVFTADEVAAARSVTPGCARGSVIHLNHAGSSLPPQVVLDAHIGHLEAEAELGGYEAAAPLTHVPTNGGLVNPAADVGALTSAAGVPFLLDACQSVGQWRIDVDEIGCDLLSATGRKYLRGPRGTGFLYVRSSVLDRLVPSQPDHHGADLIAGDRFEWIGGARRFEYWEHSVAAWLGLGAAVDHALE